MEIFLLFVSSPNVSRKRPFTAEMEEGANRILAVLLGPETANKSRTDPPELRPVRGTRDACRHSGRWCRLPCLCGWPLLWGWWPTHAVSKASPKWGCTIHCMPTTHCAMPSCANICASAFCHPYISIQNTDSNTAHQTQLAQLALQRESSSST